MNPYWWESTRESADEKREYHRRFFVQVNEKVPSGTLLLEAPDLPKLNDPYIRGDDVDLGVLCFSLSYEQLDEFGRLYQVTAKYEIPA
jgi:hypothetical protein